MWSRWRRSSHRRASTAIVQNEQSEFIEDFEKDVADTHGGSVRISWFVKSSSPLADFQSIPETHRLRPASVPHWRSTKSKWVTLGRKVRTWFRRLRTQSIAPQRAAAMRIAASAVWLYELVELRSWQADLYDLGPGQGALFDLWIVATVALLLGFRARWAAAVSFGCFFTFVTFGGENYHVDYVAQLATFYMIFADTSATWSIDALIRRVRHRAPRTSIWGFPLSAMLLHVAMVYLDSGLSHVWLNQSWRSGDAVAMSWAHPQWASSLATRLGEYPFLAELATYGTLTFELGFWLVAAWLVSDLMRRRLAGVLVFLAIATFQVGIAITYDIGMFSQFMIAVALPYLPFEGSQAYLERRDIAWPPPGPRVLITAALCLLLGSSLALMPPFATTVNRLPFLSEMSRMAFDGLRAIGDSKPHNVFADPVIATVTTAQVIDAEGNAPQIFFGPNGERVGYLRYIRAYMPVGRMLRSGAHNPNDVLDSLRPVLVRAVAKGDLGAGRYDVIVTAWPVREPDSRVLPEVWATFLVLDTGELRVP
jgi:hypothetical protein